MTKQLCDARRLKNPLRLNDLPQGQHRSEDGCVRGGVRAWHPTCQLPSFSRPSHGALPCKACVVRRGLGRWVRDTKRPGGCSHHLSRNGDACQVPTSDGLRLVQPASDGSSIRSTTYESPTTVKMDCALTACWQNRNPSADAVAQADPFELSGCTVRLGAPKPTT